MLFGLFRPPLWWRLRQLKSALSGKGSFLSDEEMKTALAEDPNGTVDEVAVDLLDELRTSKRAKLEEEPKRKVGPTDASERARREALRLGTPSKSAPRRAAAAPGSAKRPKPK